MTEVDPHELLSALLDRDAVDPDRLAALLERPAARALLVDFVRLRAALRDEGTETTGARPRVAARQRTMPVALLRIAAAVLLVALGALAGRHFATPDPDAPPEPTRVVQLVPGTAGGPR
jgi:hypothetical protein